MDFIQFLAMMIFEMEILLSICGFVVNNLAISVFNRVSKNGSF